MKRILYYYGLLLFPSLLAAQLKVEWKEELPLPGRDFIAISRIEKQDSRYIFAVATDKGSTMFEFSGSMKPQLSYTVFSYITAVDIRQSGYYTKEHCNVKFRNFNNEVMMENCFLIEPDWPAASSVSAFTDRYLYHAEWDSFLKFDLEGNLLYRKQIAELVNSQYITVGGPFIYLHSRIEKPALGPRLMQYDTLGNQKWSVATGDVYAMVADNNGNCYVMVANGETTVMKFNPAGEVVWSKLLKGQWAQGASIYGDSLLLCGNISLNAITDQNQSCAYSIMSASSGEILHQQVVDLYEDKNEREKMTTIATDGKAIYIGGTHSDENPRCFLVKLSKEGSATGLEGEIEPKASFKVFPNPGGGKFTISCATNELSAVNVTVHNISGQVVYSKKVECNPDKSFTLDLGRQAPGSYSIEITSGDQRAVKKIVVE